MERCSFTVKQLRDCGSDFISCDNQCPIEVDITLGYAPSRVTKYAGDGQFGKAEVTRNTCESMSERMWRDIIEVCSHTQAVEDTYYSDEMSVATICGKDKRRIFTHVRGIYAVHGSFSEHANLRTTLGVWEANAMLNASEPPSSARADALTER